MYRPMAISVRLKKQKKNLRLRSKQGPIIATGNGGTVTEKNQEIA